MPKWWQQAKKRINAREDDPNAVGLERDQAYDRAYDAMGQGDPSQAQAFIHDRAREGLQDRTGAENYQSLAQGHAQRAQRDVNAQFGTQAGGDPNHPLFFEIPPTRDAAGMRAHERVDDPALGRAGHLHGEYGVVHSHAGGEMPHSHPEAVFERAGFQPRTGAAAESASGTATLPEALARGAMAGAVASIPLATTPLGGGGIALGGVVGALTGGGLHYRARRRAGDGTPAGPSPWSVVFPVLLAAWLAVPSDHIDWEDESYFLELPTLEVAEADGEPADPADPAADDPAAWDPVGEASLRKYGGVTADGQPCALGRDGPALCYHRHADGGPDLARGASNNLTRGGDVFGLDDEGNPCLLGEASCRPAPDDPVLPAFPAGGAAFAGNAGPPAAPQLGRLPDGRACFVGPDNPACAPVADAGQAALPPGFGAPPPAAELPPAEPLAVPTLAPLPWLRDCLEDDPADCTGFAGGLPPLSGPGGSSWHRGTDGGDFDWQSHGWPNPGNVKGIEVVLPHSSARGCDLKGHECFRTLSQLKAAAEQAAGLGLQSGVGWVCPAIEGFRHTPANPVLQTQAQLSGQAAGRVELFVRTRDAAYVTWRPDRHGRLEYTVVRDPVQVVSVRKQLTRETIAWINAGEVQQRFPGKTAQNPDVCLVNRPTAGEPLLSWNPRDPGVHALTEASVMSEAGAVGYWDDGYEFNVALAIASASR